MFFFSEMGAADPPAIPPPAVPKSLITPHRAKSFFLDKEKWLQKGEGAKQAFKTILSM